MSPCSKSFQFGNEKKKGLEWLETEKKHQIKVYCASIVPQICMHIKNREVLAKGIKTSVIYQRLIVRQSGSPFLQQHFAFQFKIVWSYTSKMTQLKCHSSRKLRPHSDILLWLPKVERHQRRSICLRLSLGNLIYILRRLCERSLNVYINPELTFRLTLVL